jgi:hypothetical protein
MEWWGGGVLGKSGPRLTPCDGVKVEGCKLKGAGSEQGGAEYGQFALIRVDLRFRPSLLCVLCALCG